MTIKYEIFKSLKNNDKFWNFNIISTTNKKEKVDKCQQKKIYVNIFVYIYIKVDKVDMKIF